MKKSGIIFALVTVLTLPSCMKDNLYLKNPNNCFYATYTDQFNTIWGGINSCYAFWDIDKTDWDGVYEKYLPIFQEFDRRDTVSDLEFNGAYTEMLSNIIDHHLTLQVKNMRNGGNIVSISPGARRVALREDYHGRLNSVYGNVKIVDCLEGMREKGRLSNVVNSYLSDGPLAASLAHSSIITATEDSSATRILLLRLDKFDIMSRLDAKPDTSGATAMDAIENYIKLLADNSLEGIIIDVRSNGGGTIDDLQYVFGPLLEKKYTFARMRRKIGINRYDFSEWAPYSVAPMSSLRPECHYDRSNIPIVALIDMHSVSCSEMSAMLVRSLPNGTVVGERSFGGQGLLDMDFESGFSGTFGTRGDNHYCYMASYAVRDLNGRCYEGEGITPDIEAKFNILDWAQKRDTQLETAINFIAGKR